MLARLVQWQVLRDTKGKLFARRRSAWGRQQRAHRAQKDIERREWLKSFALTLALIVLTLTVAAGLASLINDGPIRL